MKKKIIMLLLSLFFIFSFAGCEKSDYEGPWWTQARANSSNTGTLDAPDFTTQKNSWVYEFGQGDYSMSTPVVVNGYIYVTCTDGYVYCIKDQKKPKIKWKFQTEAAMTNSVIYNNGIIYAAGNDGYVYALDAEKGDIIWFKSVGDAINFTPTLTSNAIVVSTEFTNTVYALSLDDGKILWSYVVTEWIVTDMTYYDGGVDGGIVFFGSDDMYFYALNANTGKLLWKYFLNSIYTQTATAYNDKVYFGSGSGIMYCFNVVNDDDVVKPIWTYECYDWVSGAPAIKDGKLVFGSEDSLVYCLDAETGERLWFYKTPYKVTSAPTIIGNSLLFAATGDRDNNYYLYCLDFDTQKFRWTSNVTQIIRTSASSVNGCVYYTTEAHGKTGKLIKLY